MHQRHSTIWSLLFVVLSLLVLGTLATGGETWAAPNAQQGTIPTVTCVVDRDGSARCTSGLTNELTFVLDPGTVPAGSVITISSLAQCPATGGAIPPIPVINAIPPIPPAGSTYTFLASCFTINVVRPDGRPITLFNPPATIFINYGSVNLEPVGNNPDKLYILQYKPADKTVSGDGITSQYVDKKTVQVRVTVSSFEFSSTFGLYGLSSAAASTSGTGGGGLGSWASSILEWIKQLAGQN